MARRDLKRYLVVCPGSLVGRWHQPYRACRVDLDSQVIDRRSPDCSDHVAGMPACPLEPNLSPSSSRRSLTLMSFKYFDLTGRLATRLPGSGRARCNFAGQGIGCRRVVDRRPRWSYGSDAARPACYWNPRSSSSCRRERVVGSPRSNRTLEGNDVSRIATTLRRFVGEIREELEGIRRVEEPAKDVTQNSPCSPRFGTPCARASRSVVRRITKLD